MSRFELYDIEDTMRLRVATPLAIGVRVDMYKYTKTNHLAFGYQTCRHSLIVLSHYWLWT